ncbi:MAG: hypothetical protein II961_07010, partial [Candidatus Riflebacteria bacterium]|nr:hypothetical protein [Candidatus Riflebacteria bacterium]
LLGLKPIRYTYYDECVDFSCLFPLKIPFRKGDAAPRTVGKLASESETEGADCEAIGNNKNKRGDSL